ncbi:MFS transporter [Burkholderia diffusa]|uniref:MFS transporter n=1 Tax=Burkholderia diffusa TaxID=488732 RepID=UPI000757B725|nr:MFS transporter [Burkholderia diffusa]KVG31352.1 MFS transporter [Burkholderia diffusa]
MFWKRQPLAVLGGLLAIHLLAHIDRNMLLGFSPQIIADIGLSNAQYGFLVGAVWVLSFGVMALFMGSLADRFSRTRVIAAGVMIWSICTWASGHAHSFEQMVLARFFVASGEAALVPAAVSLLTELFSGKRLSTAMGTFYMGIPLGVGCSFLIAGTIGAAHGWRTTFDTLGVIGAGVAILLVLLKEDRSQLSPQERGEPFLRQVAQVVAVLRARRALCLIIIGFVLMHMIFAGLSFTQLWLVKERGMNASGIAVRIGLLQLVFGTLGSVAGGVLGDRASRRLPGSLASLMTGLVALCAVPMVAYRFASPDSPFFYIGMCAGFFLPLALYGPVSAATMSMVPAKMRSTVTGFMMLSINVVAIAIGNFSAGLAIDFFSRRGAPFPLTSVLLATDLVAISSALFFACAARLLRKGALNSEITGSDDKLEAQWLRH